MKKAFSLFLLALILGACAGNEQKTLPLQTPYWQDVQVTSVAAQTQRTEVIFYPTREEALSQAFRASSNYVDLNGVWDFRYFDDHREMERWFDKQIGRRSRSKKDWSQIRVPGNWEVQGFGIPIYTNIRYDFAPKNPEPPKLPEAIPSGVYRRRFALPAAWKDRRVFLNLAGAKSGVYVYVNGQEVGYSEDSKSLARYDITDFVRTGENELQLKIYRYTAASYLEDQDFWKISGIERDVYLSSEKEANDFDFSIVSTLDEALTTGIFRLSVRGQVPDFGYELLDRSGAAVLSGEGAVTGERIFEGEVPSPRLWSTETPELYTLLLRVAGEYTRFHVGFRRLEITEYPFEGRRVHVFLVNGQPVKFKGVNLHEHNEFTGHYTDRSQILQDLKLMREANINAIRTCHYPQPREFYELCDSLGFYVYDEANIESHGMGYRLERTLGNDTTWYAKHIDRILNMYRRTANYPSVTILSLGNEAGNGENFYRAYRVLKELEQDGQNRPVCYERAEYEWNTDMIVPQYPGADWFRKMGERCDDRPVVPSEYAHAMGNSTGSLDLQWDAIYAYPQLQGAFIWDWVDQGLAEVDENGRKYWTYGGDYGKDSPSDANFNCNGIVNPDRNPHPGYWEVRHCYQNVTVRELHPEQGLYTVANRFYFRSLAGYELRYQILENGLKLLEGSLALSAPAQSSEVVRIPTVPMNAMNDYRVNFEVVNREEEPLLAAGEVVAVDEAILRKGLRRVEGSEIDPRRIVAEVYEDTSAIHITAEAFTLVFDKQLGYITEYVVDDKQVIDPDFGLRPLFWRAPTDNDYGNYLPSRCQAWKEASRNFTAEARVDADGKEVSLRVVYSLPLGTSLHVVYDIFDGGELKIHSHFQGSKEPAVDIPRLGWRFRIGLDEQTGDTFSYYGRGPQENYWDRQGAALKAWYYTDAAGEYYPYVRPQETGHHSDTEVLTFARALSVLADQPFEFSALRQYVEDLDGEECTGRDYQWNNFDPDAEKNPDEARHVLRRQTHINDVPIREDIEVVIDHRMSGVGGYDSWGSRPEAERTLWSHRDYDWTFYIKPL